LLEDVARTRRPAALIEELGLDQTAEAVTQPRLVDPGDRLQHVIGEFAAEYGAHLRDLAHRR
jgi:sugar (pentulose or hexulose) kinase